jgi:hypothetical protein
LDHAVVSLYDWRSDASLPPLNEKRTHGVQRLRCRLQVSDAASEPVRHPPPQIEPGIDSGSNGTVNISARIVEQYFVVTNVNAERRHAGKASLEGRSQRLSWVGGFEVGMHEFRDLRASEKGSASARVS